jgi:molybdate/tungstate transport system permease protein
MVAALVPFLFILAPIIHMVSTANLSDVWTVLHDDTFLSSLETSMVAALLTTACAIVFGLPAAFLLSIWQFRGRRWVEAVLLLPLVMPPLVGGTAEISVFGPNTWLGAWFAGHGAPLTDSLIGVVLAQAFVTSPFLILAARAGFDEVPRDLLEATRLAGGGLWAQFWSVYLPLSRQAIGAGVLLTFARSIGEFGATLIMAYHPYTVPVDIWTAFTSGGLNAIIPMAVVLLFVSILIVGITSWIPRSYSR